MRLDIFASPGHHFSRNPFFELFMENAFQQNRFFLVFEFLNLLVHPYLEKITHHSPLLMLLSLVALAAMLIPLHHKLEHWAVNKLIEKNKLTRLAAAKKTIEELEKKD